MISRKMLISASVNAGPWFPPSLPPPPLPPPDHLLDLLFDCPSKEVDCSVFDCCSFITTKKENKKIKKN
jgi:hypothetical protein